MQNKTLANDYLTRSLIRLKALDLLFNEASYADVVRESQEVVELTLKALLRLWNIEVPRVHDVSSILEDQKKKFPKLQKEIDEFCSASRELRRDRELAFYGSEDLTPSEFYKKSDAERARGLAQKTVKKVIEISESLDS